MLNKIIVSFLLPLTIILSGCINKLQNMVADAFPTYQETVNGWPPLDENHSRIVLFSFDRKLYEIAIGPYEPFSDPNCIVTIDGADYPGMINGTFIFIDVTAGEHDLSCTSSNSTKLKLTTGAKEVVYIGAISPLKVTPLVDIQEHLTVLNHAFDDALAYDDQPITIKRRSKE
ncbi:MAG: hypothetical protein ACPG52_13520 [Cognaticolwellia sp.]